MEELINKIQAVINTLEGLEIQSKRNTMLQLLGCMQVLAEVQQALKEPMGIKMEEAENGGNDHAE